MNVLETPRMLLRRLVPEDLDDLAALYADPEVMHFWPRPYSRDETRQELERMTAYYEEHGFGLWATLYKPDGRFIGRCGLLRKTVDGVPELEVAYMIARACWGRGLATEAARGIAGYAFRELGPPRLVSFIGEYASLLEAIGFRVTYAVHFDRPTPLEGGESDLRAWLAMFGGRFLAAVPDDLREAVVAEIEERLRGRLWRDEQWWADYIRLRVVATKPDVEGAP
ncbi:MAG TPA: GNAT family N-acetyltransferase [Armatimonadota bacterium]|nr:GNAT family N-acetyltransferase [Armatimonadota bacterium]